MSMKSKKKTKDVAYKRGRKGKYGIILLVLLFFILTAGYLMIYTDFFMIEEIEVVGNDFIDQKEIIRMSDLEMGMNIFKFNTGEIKGNIGRHSFIKNVEIAREYPNKVVISIVEREITAIVPFEDGTFLYVDEEGIVMEKSQTLNTFSNPLITGLENVSFIMGNPIEINPSGLKNSVLGVISNLKGNNLLDKISEVHILEDYTIELYTKDGSVITIGDETILEKKIEFIKSYMLQSHPNEIIDISHGGDPVSKPRTN